MPETATVGPWIRRFLLEHLEGERNLARNTQRSYRDTIRLLIVYLESRLKKRAEALVLTDISADHIRQFLAHLEAERHCKISTRNQRLAAIRALAHFIAQRAPEHLAWSTEIHAISVKRGPFVPITYLEKSEMDALLEAPDRATKLGRRDHALLLFLYNSGARAEEAAQLKVADLTLEARLSQQSFVRLLGKGNKVRLCPLWASTAAELRELTAGRASDQPVFMNRLLGPLTRFGVYEIITRYARSLAGRFPRLGEKRPSPHTIRHTCATHLLRAGVDINTIRAWLGHVSINTTNIYAEIDLEMKSRALAKCAVPAPKDKPWREDPGLMAFLQSL